MKILVADDSKLVLSLISSLIKSLGEQYQVLTASNGAEAITVTESEKPDLILMDWQMPILSGLDALKKIKEAPATRHIPVIMLTASENTTEAFRYGATDFIQKPFQKEEFLSRIRNILAAVKSPKESEEEMIKTEWLQLEAEKDRLRDLKETQIRQKKELTQVVGNTKTLHQKFYLESPALQTNFPEHFVLSHAIFDIPSHMIWVKRQNDHQILLAVCIFPNRGISAFLSAFVCEKILDTLGSTEEKDLKTHYHTALSTMKAELGVEPRFKLLQIDSLHKNIVCIGANLQAYLYSNKFFTNLNTHDTAPLSYQKGDALYIIQNGFLENIDAQNSQDIFLDYLQLNGDLPFEKQKLSMDESIKNWQKELRQQNDILALAVRLS
ncbi:MAG: response regulator [Bacteroidales bacterium]